jgi:hypothetical protein
MKILDDDINYLKEIHNNFYDYSKVDRNFRNKKICIICPEHGKFWQMFYNHKMGQKCSECVLKGNNIKSNTKDFIKKAQKIHGNKYDYSKVEYKTAFKEVYITCTYHGDWLQKPNSHLNGMGCRQCGNKSSLGLYNKRFFEKFPERKNKKATFYIMDFGKFFKVGITTSPLNIRFPNIIKKGKFRLFLKKELNLYNAWKLEQKFLKKFENIKYRPSKLESGITECFLKTDDFILGLKELIK